jgi:hypothetical protein
VQQAVHRRLAKQHDNLRPDQGNLAFEIRPAGGHLGRFRRAIAGRPAFDRIGDIDLLATNQIDGGQHVVEQLAGLADEGFALHILIRARPLADEQPVGLKVANPEHRLLALLAQGAGAAGGNRPGQCRPVQGVDRCRCRCCAGVGGSRFNGWRHADRRR